MTATRCRSVVVCVLGFLSGVGIGYMDSRPTWDDTGITVGGILLAAAVLGAADPRVFWIAGLAVGIPVLGMNVYVGGGYAAAVAALIAVAAAGVGAAVRRFVGSGGSGTGG